MPAWWQIAQGSSASGWSFCQRCEKDVGAERLAIFPHLSAGILFSTLVFGPACGFILGSVCTKFYVDAVLIDTGELPQSTCVCVCADVTPGRLRSQTSWASARKTRAGSAPGGRASSCAPPCSSARRCRCSASLSRCPARTAARRAATASRPCSPPPLRLQTRRLPSPAATAPPAASNSGVSLRQCTFPNANEYRGWGGGGGI